MNEAKEEFRPYQQTAKEALFDHLQAGNRQALVVQATGLGKTYWAARIARDWLNTYGNRVLFISHLVDAILQARYEEFRVAFSKAEDNFGILVGYLKKNLDANILFSTFQSMKNYLDSFQPDYFGLIIVDEAHHACARTFRDVIEYFRPKFLLGLTATPDRMDGQNIRDIFGEEVFQYSLFDALSDGQWLAKVSYRVMADNIDKKQLNELLKRVSEGDRKVSRADINRTVFLKESLDEQVKGIRRLQSEGNKKTIVFCRSISHIYQVSKRFPEAVPYHSKLSPMILAERFEAFRQGKSRIILVVGKFNEAVNIPDAQLGVLLRPTESKVIWPQQLGRLLRRTPEIGTVIILDYVANVYRLAELSRLAKEIKTISENPLLEVETKWKISFTPELVDILEILRQLKRDFYEMWEEASQAARKFGINTMDDYRLKYYKDPRLPSAPERHYKDVWNKNGGWAGFLGKKIYNPYRTYRQTSKAAHSIIISGGFYHVSQNHEHRHC